MGNPFIEKAERRRNSRRERAQRIAQRNHAELVKLFARFTEDDDPATIERVKRRVEEASEAARHYA